MLTTAIPNWVSILFLLSISIPIYMIANVARQGAINAKLEPQKSSGIFMSILLFFGLYFAYTSVLSFKGIFLENTLPPKIFFYTAFPLFAFLFLVISNLKVYKTIVQNVALESLVQVHLFRLIGIFFFITSAYDAIPTKFALIAGIGDLTTALTSIFVVSAIKNNKSYSKPLLIAWNIFGLLDIVSVLATAIITTKLSIATGSQDLTAIGIFPFCLIPAFAPATIIFLHVSIFRKLGMEKKKVTLPKENYAI